MKIGSIRALKRLDTEGLLNAFGLRYDRACHTDMIFEEIVLWIERSRRVIRQGKVEILSKTEAAQRCFMVNDEVMYQIRHWDESIEQYGKERLMTIIGWIVDLAETGHTDDNPCWKELWKLYRQTVSVREKEEAEDND